MFRQAGKAPEKPKRNPPKLQLVMLQLSASVNKPGTVAWNFGADLCNKLCKMVTYWRNPRWGEEECVWSHLQSLSKYFWAFASQNVIVSLSSCAWCLDSHPPKHWFNGLRVETHCVPRVFWDFVTAQSQSEPEEGSRAAELQPSLLAGCRSGGRLCSLVWDIQAGKVGWALGNLFGGNHHLLSHVSLTQESVAAARYSWSQG